MIRILRSPGCLAVTVALAAFSTTVAAQTQPKPVPPAPFADVITVMKNTAATDADRQKLVGRAFAGDVIVSAVRFSSTDPALAFVEVEVADASAKPVSTVHMRFEVRRDDPKLLELRPSQTVRFKGTLKQLSGVPAFGDTVIG